MSLAQGSEYVPMIWGEGDLTEARLRQLSWVGKNSSYLLGFNEPNYGSQVPSRTAHNEPEPLLLSALQYKIHYLLRAPPENIHIQ